MALSDNAKLLLGSIDGVPRARQELLSRSGLASGDWRGAISELLDAGRVTQFGRKRGTRYTLRTGAMPRESAPRGKRGRRQGTAVEPSHASSEYHDLVAEALEELGLSTDSSDPADAQEPSTRGRRPRKTDKKSLLAVTRPQVTCQPPQAPSVGCPILAAVIRIDPLVSANSCSKCGSDVELWVGRKGPFSKCEVRECGNSQLVDAVTVDSALRELDVSCAKCGKEVRPHGGMIRSGVRCSEGHLEGWKDLKKRVRLSR